LDEAAVAATGSEARTVPPDDRTSTVHGSDGKSPGIGLTIVPAGTVATGLPLTTTVRATVVSLSTESGSAGGAGDIPHAIEVRRTRPVAMARDACARVIPIAVTLRDYAWLVVN
jgi:hypothetical protein